ncbi:MAG: hypothetical protein Q9M97_01485 [Candidatus Gracilibacteria bacterium]|nr:hypothetical protein [Candidatus Gracilibacteria bacterium]
MKILRNLIIVKIILKLRQGENIKKEADQRLNIAQINKNDFYNSKRRKNEIIVKLLQNIFIENDDIENYFFIVKKI